MDSNEQKQLQHLMDVERKAEGILVDKNDSISLDMRRNWDRESLRAIEKLKDREKVWTIFGPNITKLTKEKAKSYLNQDLVSANIEINTIRSDMKVKLNDLRDLEYQDKYTGFDLKALSRKELSAMKQVWGGTSSSWSCYHLIDTVPDVISDCKNVNGRKFSIFFVFLLENGCIYFKL